MKKQVAILLLLCYTSVLLRPLAPCVSDFLAHTFWESEHMTTVHYENGEYHVHVEIMKAAEDTQEQPVQDTMKKGGEETVVHLLPSAQSVPLSSHLIITYLSYGSFIPEAAAIPVPSPPPWLA